MPLRPAVCLAALAAAVLAFAPQGVAAPAPCVATGLLAMLAPGQTAPTIVGPSLAAADRESTTADAVTDPATGLDVVHADLGVAGCVGVSAPGGTAAHADAWSVLDSVRGDSLDADLVPTSGDGSGWHLRATPSGFTVNGVATDVTAGQHVQVASWGVLEAQVDVDAGAGQPLRWWRAALALHLVNAHAGLPAGTTLLIGWVSANKRPAASPAPAPAPTPPPPKPKPKPKPVPTTTAAPTTTTVVAPPKPKATGTRTQRHAPKPKPKVKVKVKPKPKHKAKHKAKPTRPGDQPLKITPPLAAATYDFPVTGDVTWGDTYGAARSDVPGGWHHGDDLFAPLGTPVVAVADGTVFSVGWNHVGGWRLWLRTDAGDSFYYAHLAGYTALAKNNNRVQRGEVLGFVGNTGDAFTTWPHLHFEIHPNELLSLGYDGAVDPSTYLDDWHRVQSLKAPPPVRLPSSAGRGQGAITDFRKLLAIRPLKITKTGEPGSHSEPGSGVGSRPRSAVASASRPVASAHPSEGDGWPPIAAALGLVAIAAGAVGIAVRNGRSR